MKLVFKQTDNGTIKEIIQEQNHFFVRVTEPDGEVTESQDYNTIEKAKESIGIKIVKTKQEIVLEQIELQEQIQSAGFNIVECGNCGTVLLHKRGEDEIDCFCGHTMALSDCPDLYYSGMENNQEFQD